MRPRQRRRLGCVWLVERRRHLRHTQKAVQSSEPFGNAVPTAQRLAHQPPLCFLAEAVRRSGEAAKADPALPGRCTTTRQSVALTNRTATRRSMPFDMYRDVNPDPRRHRAGTP